MMVVLWTVILAGYALHKRREEDFDLGELMFAGFIIALMLWWVKSILAD